MTPVAQSTKFCRRLIPVASLLILTAALLSVRAAAQPASPPPPPPAPDSRRADSKDDPGWEGGAFDRVRFPNESVSHYYYSSPFASAEHPALFFPPLPPPLYAEFPLLGPLPRSTPAPPELAAFVDELFYPLLGARLAEDDLAKPLRGQLQAYRVEKVALQNELRTRIAGLKDTRPAERERQLAAFAAAQATRIAALEAMAEKIRTDLGRTGLFGLRTEGSDWTEYRGWLLQRGRGPPAAPADPRVESKALRAAAFFQDGLSAAQRRLLNEAAIAFENEANAPAGSTAAAPEGWLLHFSPEPARIRIVASLPAPLAKKISEYVSAKKDIQTEIRQVLQGNADTGSTARLAALKQLAVTQAPGIAALETAAEEIRRDLAALPNPPGPPAPPALPPELVARISAYRAHKVELLKTLYVMLAGSAKTVEQEPVQGVSRTEGLAGRMLSWVHDSSTPAQVTVANLTVPVAEFSRRQNELVGELNREQAGIREALAEYERAANQPADRKSINDLLKDFECARQQQEIWDKYRDYQTAVLLPGLSPEQRRLLFGAAIVQLALPLPAGEQVP